MSRTVKIVIIVVLVIAAIAAVTGLVGLAVAHHDGFGYGPRQMMGPNGFRFPGQMRGSLHFYGFGQRHWAAFMVLPWFSLILLVALVVALLIWRPRQVPAASATASGPAGGPTAAPPAGDPALHEQFEQWHRETHAQGLAHEPYAAEATTAVPEAQAPPEPPANPPEPPAAPSEPPADQGRHHDGGLTGDAVAPPRPQRWST